MLIAKFDHDPSRSTPLAQFLFDAKIRELQTTEDHSAAAHVRVAQRVIPDLRLLPISPDQGKEYLRQCRPDLYLQRYGEDPGKESWEWWRG